MAGKLLIQSTLLPVEAVSLGRLVVDVHHPQRRYHDPLPDKSAESTIQVEKDVQEMAQRLHNKRASLSLTELLTTFKTKRNIHDHQIQAATAVTYTLNQWEHLFRTICGLATTRRWLEDAIEDGNDVYFIVGYRTFIDPAAREGARLGEGSEHSIQAPVGTVAEANLYGLQLGGVLDPEVTKSKEKSDSATRSFAVGGECVYAVQYCKVNFKWFSSRKVDSSSLGENKWKIYLGVRGEEEDEDGEDDVVEAGLEKEWHLDDSVEFI